MKISLIADQAIGESDLRTADGLGFETYAQVLATAAADTKGPFTIGVFGEWGTGKTSLLRLIKRQLDQNPQVVTVWFNAWRHDKEEHPIVPLVGTIVHELEEHKAVPAQTRRTLVGALRAIAYGFSAKAKVKVPGFAEVEASFVAKEMIDRDERLRSDPLLDRSLYYGAFNRLDAVQLEDELRVVVLIDDLDRCFPDQAIQLLESIKLVLAQPGFIFILGVARRVIEGYLQHRYTTEYGISDFKGQLYLDKMVQLPFHIPPYGGRMADFSESLLAGQPSDVVQELKPVLALVAEVFGGNPRSLIRFINNILIDTAISSELARLNNTPPIPVQLVAISRCLELRWPDVLSTLLASDELAADVVRWNRADFARRASEEGDQARVAAALLSEPELQMLLLGSEGKLWLRNAELRHASVDFLRDQRRLSPLDPAEVRPRWDAYFSYLLSDRSVIVEIVEKLSQRGLRIPFGRLSKIGETTVEQFEAAPESAPIIAYFIGPDRSGVELQQEGLNSAIDRAQAVIPVLLPGADGSQIPPQLRARWVDLRQGVTHVGIGRLADAIEAGNRRPS
ncbi:MAG TPA: P-loop NTPase fold protein [Actinophytocola sp.]|uniref:P-loop NTPase fold protein n=1 Tax=Actinophytocola sp. TaxID=1872138 RepID=UPI002DF9E90D|nr:P-loop NTPase fold protein [Actinophytocola sp.]